MARSVAAAARHHQSCWRHQRGGAKINDISSASSCYDIIIAAARNGYRINKYQTSAAAASGAHGVIIAASSYTPHRGSAYQCRNGNAWLNSGISAIGIVSTRNGNNGVIAAWRMARRLSLSGVAASSISMAKHRKLARHQRRHINGINQTYKQQPAPIDGEKRRIISIENRA